MSDFSSDSKARPTGNPADGRDDASDRGPETDVAALLERMRAGDRDAAAEFVHRYGSRIRRRMRSRLGQPVRRVFDSEDILSTLGRKLDQYVAARRIEAMTEGELWALVTRIVASSTVDKARRVQRAERAERVSLDRRPSDDEEAAAPEIDVASALGAITDQTDRHIAERWLAGATSSQIGETVGLTAVTVRKRLQAIRRTIGAALVRRGAEL